MRPAKIFLLGIAVGLTSQAAVAFQEQGGKPPATDEKPAASVMPAAPGAGGSSSSMPRAGTEIRIPGIGAVGTLPKFDFGLELLYGAGENRTIEPQTKSEPSEMQIRGTLKYKFGN